MLEKAAHQAFVDERVQFGMRRRADEAFEWVCGFTEVRHADAVLWPSRRGTEKDACQAFTCIMTSRHDERMLDNSTTTTVPPVLPGCCDAALLGCVTSAERMCAGLWACVAGSTPFASPAGRRSRGWKPRFMTAFCSMQTTT